MKKFLKKYFRLVINIRYVFIVFYNSYLKVLNKKKWGKYGENSQIGLPFSVTRLDKIFLDDYCRINPGANFIIYDGNVIIKKFSELSYNVTIVTGNHLSTVGIPQYFLGQTHINDIEKDVIIEEDVWIGANVTILSGVNIGRGAIVGATSLVNKNVPPYAIIAGIPAKIIGVKFSLEQILNHEKEIYKKEERLSELFLKGLFEKYFFDKKKYGTSYISEDDKLKLEIIRKNVF